MSSHTYIPKRAMIIVAHPDDIEFGCAGTAARWVKEGCEVSYVLCTSGDVGIATEGMTKAEAGRIREAEQSEAARIVGVNEVIYLREPDGMLENTMELRKRLVREIRRFKPEAVIVMDPTLVWAIATSITRIIGRRARRRLMPFSRRQDNPISSRN